jgi:hypothetical protein
VVATAPEQSAMAPATRVLGALSLFWFLRLSGGEAVNTGHCDKDAADGSCAAAVSSSKRAEFWAEIKRRGLYLKIKKHPNRTAMILSDDVYYGRAIMKIPRAALISLESAPNVELRRECTRFLFDDEVLAKKFNITAEDSIHLLSLAFPLVAEFRNPDSLFRDWLDATKDQQMFVLTLSERQLRVLNGTTVEGARKEMEAQRSLIQDTAGNLTYFQKARMTLEEADWALAVIMKHSRVVHPHQDVRETRAPRMYLFPLLELLDVQLHPDPNKAISFQEEITLEDGKREEEMVLQIARRDIPKGEEVFLWPGRLSNSEMVVRHGISFEKNLVGIGRNVSQPPNWSEDPEAKLRKEYDRYNCSTLTAFELRVNVRGYPMQNFVRCYRISYFLTQGWYQPGLIKRVRELNKWPPPEKYTSTDWLTWTQADQEVNKHILEYCADMRRQLKDTMDAETAADFRKSTDPVDRLVWQLRGEETRSFKECMTVAKRIKEG